jgi:hypothetical protein
MVYAVLAVAFASMSLAVTGFRIGANNVFHIPYVLNLAALPQFQGNALFATLDSFTSVIWPPLRLVATESNLRALFETAHFISRVAAFGAMVFLIRANGLRSLAGIAACLSVLALTPWLRYFSIVGVHGMFIDHFTQSELTWPFVFLSLTLLQRGRHAASAAMTGIAFAINAFVGMWLLFISLFVVSFDRAPRNAASIARAAGAFFLCASPAILWIAFTISAPGSEAVNSFSYIEYIRRYYPDHFLIEAAAASKLGVLALLYAVGFLAAGHLAAARFWTLVQVGCLLIFLVGIPLPYLWDNRFVFNLHLLRSDGIEQAIAVILAAMAGVKLLCSVDSGRRQLAGVIILYSLTASTRSAELVAIALALAAGLLPEKPSELRIGKRSIAVSPRYGRALIWLALVVVAGAQVHQILNSPLPFAPVVRLLLAASLFVVLGALVVKRRLVGPSRRDALLGAIVVLAVGTSAAASWQRIHVDWPYSPKERSGHELAAWIRSSNIGGVFLLPVGEGDGWLNSFQVEARRPVWVDWKQGAAVMWSPSFHRQWMPRYSEVSALRTPNDFIAYARDRGIENIIVESEAGECPPPSMLVKSNAHYALCRLSSDSRPVR